MLNTRTLNNFYLNQQITGVSPPSGGLTATTIIFRITAAATPVGVPAAAISFPANSPAGVRARILNRRRKLVAEVRDLEWVQWNRNFWGNQRFTLVVPARVLGAINPVLAHLREGNYVLVQYKSILANPAEEWADEYLGDIEYIRYSVSAGGAAEVEVRGESLLARRIIVPFPTFAYYETTGPAETVLRETIINEFDTGAVIRRRADNIAVGVDQARGATVHFKARYNNLLEKMQEYAQQANLGFELSPGDNGYVLTFNEGTDRSTRQTTNPPVIFSPERKNVLSQEMVISTINRPNVTYIGGDGEGADRKVVIINNSIYINEDVLGEPVQGTALQLDGTTQSVVPPTTATLKGRGTGTVEGWFYADSLSAFNSIFYESINASGLARFEMYIGSDGKLVLDIRPNSDSGLSTYISTFTFPTQRWCWAAAQFDFDANEVKLRGWVPTLADSNTDTFTHTGSTQFANTTPLQTFIGASIAGRVAKWRVWGEYLSAAMLDDARQVIDITESWQEIGTLLADWRMDEGYGVWINDYATRDAATAGRMAKAINGATWVSGPDVEIGVPDGGRRREQFIDARDIDDFGGLADRAKAKFREQGPKATFESEILATGPYRYKVHWNLGDIVTTANEDFGVEAHARIVDVECTAKRGETPRIKLTFGAPTLSYTNAVEKGLKWAEIVLRR
jgi:hypothetical protein